MMATSRAYDTRWNPDVRVAEALSTTVRPLPQNLPPFVRRVRLCDRRSSCRGPIHCKFPHNQREMDEWNRQLSQGISVETVDRRQYECFIDSGCAWKLTTHAYRC